MGLKRDVGLPPHLFHSALQAGNFGYLPFILSSDLMNHDNIICLPGQPGGRAAIRSESCGRSGANEYIRRIDGHIDGWTFNRYNSEFEK